MSFPTIKALLSLWLCAPAALWGQSPCTIENALQAVTADSVVIEAFPGYLNEQGTVSVVVFDSVTSRVTVVDFRKELSRLLFDKDYFSLGEDERTLLRDREKQLYYENRLEFDSCLAGAVDDPRAELIIYSYPYNDSILLMSIVPIKPETSYSEVAFMHRFTRSVSFLFVHRRGIITSKHCIEIHHD